MITKRELISARKRAAIMLKRAGIAITPREAANIEVADFGLGDLRRTGLELVVYQNNKRYCAKELVLFPGQTCPEHRHPAIGGKPGKMETFRCRWGSILLFIPGGNRGKFPGRIPQGRDNFYTVRRAIKLGPGEQFTIPPNTRHWFQSGPRGAVVSEFSSTSRDAADVFTDPSIKRKTVVR